MPCATNSAAVRCLCLCSVHDDVGLRRNTALVTAQTSVAQTINTHNQLQRVCEKQALLDKDIHAKLLELNQTTNSLFQIIGTHKEELRLTQVQLQQQGQSISRDTRQGLVLLQRETLERHAQSQLHRDSLERNLHSVLGITGRVVALENKVETLTRAASADGAHSIPINQSADAPPPVVVDAIDGTRGAENGGNAAHAPAPSSSTPPPPAPAEPAASVDGASAFAEPSAAKRPAEEMPAAPAAKQPRAALSQQAHLPELNLLNSLAEFGANRTVEKVVPDVAAAAAAAQPSSTLTTPSSPSPASATTTFAELAQAPQNAADHSTRHAATAAETTASTAAASDRPLSPTQPNGTEASNGAPAASTPPSTDDTVPPSATCTQLGRAAELGKPHEALAELTIAQQALHNQPHLSEVPTKLITIEELTHISIADPAQVCAQRCMCTQHRKSSY